MPLHLPLDDSVMCVCELERRLMCWDEHKINLTHVFSEEIDESPKSLPHDILFGDVSCVMLLCVDDVDIKQNKNAWKNVIA